ncbi:RNA-directed DNA polymerase from mobile element jockey [Elysia marginata]|uniref:RNA-directed DNA polymerase from mobile element jockey n=1 Tax=Elysia marginata TaxID=1093978 RepID=A0AAV4FBV4_9GAST|nr:RNA-directed DNA polymerase from mobile element jockey [Elysia marginata]
MVPKVIKRIEGKRAPTRVEPLVVDGHVLPSWRAEAEAFNKFYASIGNCKDTQSEKDMKRERRELQKRPTANQRYWTTEFTMAELELAIRKGKTGKAPGRDSVTQEMIQNMSPSAKLKLLALYNRTWTEGSVPVAWRTATIVPILKGWKSQKEISSYRPISLTSTVSKTMEPMVNALLYHYLEESKELDESQAGFR